MKACEASPQFEWLHLTDLHLSLTKKWDSDPIVQGLLDDLERAQKEENFRPDVIFFTGDAVFGNLQEDSIDAQYRAFGEFLDAVRASFDPPIPASAVYLVPGNHDVDRSNVLEAEKDWLRNDRNKLESIESALGKNTPDCKQWMSRLAPYRSFLKSYGLTHLDPDSETLIYRDEWVSGDLKVEIFGLNSAWSCCERKEKGSLRMGGRWQSGKLNLHKKSTAFKFVLLHHPPNWLHESEDPDFQRWLRKHSNIQLHGHEHSQFITPYADGGIVVSGGAIYDNRERPKAFSYGSVDLAGDGTLYLREWDDSGSGWVKKAIAGMAPSGSYSISLSRGKSPGKTSQSSDSVKSSTIDQVELTRHLKAEFEKAATCYSSYSGAWVERTFSTISEADAKTETSVLITVNDICDGIGDILIHAPVNFGMTCVGHRIALQKASRSDELYLYLRIAFKPHPEAVKEAIESRLAEIGAAMNNISGIVLDGVAYDKATRRIIKSIRTINDSWRIIALHSRDDMADLSAIGQEEVFNDFQSFHLWSLSRKDVRDLVEKCVSDSHVLSEEALTEKIIADIDALNIHRTPLNCLTLLKTNENQVDETPVNRTEMIKRVLTLFFNQFNSVPRYSERPDLVDCEYTLGMFAELLIRRQEYSFTKSEFMSKSTTFAENQKLPLEVDVLFMFLASERIIVQRGGKFEFRFAYWLHYFAAHRMHHSADFRSFMLDEGRYIFFPEIIEFYSGIDRRRDDAVKVAIRDLKRLNEGFSDRSGISPKFNPYSSAEWRPSGSYLEEVSEEIEDEVKGSALPQEAKDAIADRTYDRSKAYRQEVQAFIKASTLPELVSACRGAAKTLRNSDYVSPNLRKELLEEVTKSWEKVAQALLIIAPILARHGRASFEGMGFELIDFDDIPDEQRLHAVVEAIPRNVVNWFEEDLHSKKLGVLCLEAFAKKENSIAAILLRRAVILHKPRGWNQGVESFVAGEPKKSYYLYDVFRALRAETRFGHKSTVQTCKHLAAIVIAKHWTDKARPNQKTIREALARLEEAEQKDT